MSVEAPEVSCAESEHRHGKCSKWFGNLEKNLPQPPIDEKHKQRNQEILERKRKPAIAGRKMSRKISEQESFQIAAKLALERQQQKQVEVFDSHAIDITQFKDTDDSEIFLPRHLKKRQSSQSLNLNKSNTLQFQQPSAQNDEGGEMEEVTESGEGTFEELRRASLAYGILGAQQTSPLQHDTLQAYFKFRTDNMAKEDRLKRVQATAKIRNIEEETVNSPSSVRKAAVSNSRALLPPLKKLSFHGNSDTKSNSVSAVYQKNKTNVERRGRLPKIARRKSKGKDGLIGRDPRFQKLLSSLVPLSDKTKGLPPFSRKRHYTM